MTRVKLDIADTIIQIKSEFPIKQYNEEEITLGESERLSNFICEKKKSPDISIDLKVVDKLPDASDAKPLFVARLFQDKSENWRLLEKDGSYIYLNLVKGSEQLMLVNKDFDRVIAYLLDKKEETKSWKIEDLVYDFLQILLINYFAKRQVGLFTHSVGIKDVGGNGLFFAGKSGAGKSTTARLWHQYTKAMILNDDRVIVRRNGKRFFIHSSPWHGDFLDYLATRKESALLEKAFFIYHSEKNTQRKIDKQEAFEHLYPSIFPAFWDKDQLSSIAELCLDLIKQVPCYSLGFVKDKSVIDYVRRINVSVSS